MIKQRQQVNELVKLAFTLLFVAAVVVAMSAVFYGQPIMRLLYPPHALETLADYELRLNQSAMVFSLLMCGFLPISTTYVFGTLLTANGNLKQMNIVAASAMLFNIILNLILVPRLFAVGSAITSLTTQSIAAILQVLVVLYIFKFRIDYRFLVQLFVFVIGSVLLAWASIGLGIHWIKSLAMLIIIILIYSMILKLLDIKSFVKILKGFD
jgi:O-antigen/teichoic acid export membrane protein